MTQLPGYQKKFLRGAAHGLRPVVLIGHKGLTEAALEAISEALRAHELIKVKFNEFKDKAGKRAILGQMEERLACHVAGMIGHTAVIFRPHPDPEKRRVRLPTR